MKKIITTAAAIIVGFTLSLTAGISTAAAGDKIVTTTSNCGGSYNRTSNRSDSGCETTTVIQSLKSWREMSPEERAEARADADARDQRIAKWEAFCQPTPKQGIDGITRMQYAHKNCDMGRSE